MKKRLGALLLAVMVVMGLVLLAGCSKKPTLVGTWKVVSLSYDGQEEVPEGDPLYLTFSGDGQWASWYMVENGKATTEENSGTYSTAGNTLTMSDFFDTELGTQTDSTYKISGTNLTITAAYDDGTVCMRLTRAD